MFIRVPPVDQKSIEKLYFCFNHYLIYLDEIRQKKYFYIVRFNLHLHFWNAKKSRFRVRVTGLESKDKNGEKFNCKRQNITNSA